MGNRLHKRAYPAGPVVQMTPEWKALVEPAIKRKGKTKTWLASQIRWLDEDGAERVGVDKSAITVMLRPTTGSSRLVPEVCRLLDLPLPVHGIDLEKSDILDLASRLDDDQLAAVKAMMRQLARKPPPRSDP